MNKYSRLQKLARSPISVLVEDIKTLQTFMQGNEAIYDQRAFNGYDKLIHNLEYYEQDINSQPPDYNTVWDILEKLAPNFTAVQYLNLVDKIKNYLSS